MPGDVAMEGYKPDAYVRTLPAARPDKDAKLPGMNDPYQAAGHPENGELSRLVLIMGKDGFKPGATAYYIMQYVHIGLGEFGFDAHGQFFRFLFSDLQPKLVMVRGRSLLRICDYISLRRMPWIRQADRDFRLADGAVDGEPFITRIEVTDWVRPED
jgi:hypothetical protein